MHVLRVEREVHGVRCFSFRGEVEVLLFNDEPAHVRADGRVEAEENCDHPDTQPERQDHDTRLVPLLELEQRREQAREEQDVQNHDQHEKEQGLPDRPEDGPRSRYAIAD